jgi:beta-glucanase (GH16 family)
LDAEHEFHTIAFEWTEDYLKWYLDGTLYHSCYKQAILDDGRRWVFDSEFHLILNYAYGGSWGGQMGIDDSKLPQEFILDYVRVYQKRANAGKEVKNAGFSMKQLSDETLIVTAPSLPVTIDLYSAMGSKQITRRSHTPDTEIDIASLPKGVYILSVSDGNSLYSGQFIK